MAASLEVRPLGEFEPFGASFGISFSRGTKTDASRSALPLGPGTASSGVPAPSSSRHIPFYTLSEAHQTFPSSASSTGSAGWPPAEEELAVLPDRRTVVWSRGAAPQPGTLKATFDFEHVGQPIEHCLWARFRRGDPADDFVQARQGEPSRGRGSSLRPRATSTASISSSVGSLMDIDVAAGAETRNLDSSPQVNTTTDRALCVLFRDMAAFQFDDGRSYLTNLPFRVRRAFALPGTEGGLLLEREARPRESPTDPLGLPAQPANEGSPGSAGNPDSQPTPFPAALYTVMHPLEQPRAVAVFQPPPTAGLPATSTRRLLTSSSTPFSDLNERVIFVYPESTGSNAAQASPLVVTHNVTTGKHSAWQLLSSHLDPLDRAAMFPAPPPAPTPLDPNSPVLPRPGQSKDKDKEKERRRTRRPGSHAPKRSSILPAGPGETPVYRLEEPRVDLPEEEDVYAKAIAEWQGAPVVFFKRIWEESGPTRTDAAAATVCVVQKAEGKDVLVLHDQSQRRLSAYLVASAGTAPKVTDPFLPLSLVSLFTTDATSAISIRATRPSQADLLILRTDFALALWTGDFDPTDGPLLVPCELPRNFQERIPAPLGKKRRRTPGEDASSESDDEGNLSATSGVAGGDTVFRSPSRSSRVVALKDSVGSRVNAVLSDGFVLRADLQFHGSEGTATRLAIEAMAAVLPPRLFASFRHRFLRLQYGGFGLEDSMQTSPKPSSSDWDNLLVAFFSFCHPPPAGVARKTISKPVPTGAGPVAGDQAWEALLASDLHERLGDDPIFRKLEVTTPVASQLLKQGLLTSSFEKSRELHLRYHTEPGFRDRYPALLAALHFAYEEAKLSVLTQLEASKLVQLCYQLAHATGNLDHAEHYRRDGFVQEGELDLAPLRTENIGLPADIYRWLYNAVKTGQVDHFPTLGDLRQRYLADLADSAVPHSEGAFGATTRVCSVYRALLGQGVQAAVLAMVEQGVSVETLDCWPDGVALPAREALRICRADPPRGWTREAYVLLDREDLAEQMSGARSAGAYAANQVPHLADDDGPLPDIGELTADALKTGEADPGKPNAVKRQFSDVDRLRFAKDRRLDHAAEMLQTEEPIRSKLPTTPEDDPAEIPARQQSYLTILASRTYAIPAGRAILDFSTIKILASTDIANRPLAVTAKFGRTTATLDLSPFPPDSADLPEFHDGVAQGLQIAPDCPDVDSSWIVYHRPADVTTPRHAGFLFALGLNGHLRKMSSYHSLTYLTNKHDLTSIGLLLGLAAAHVGTCNDQVTRLLAVHVPALLPHHSSDMNVSSTTQIAGVLGVGLLYMGSMNRRNVEILLAEIGRREMVSTANETVSVNMFREGYSLAAGFALGFITLGKGNEAHGLSDIRIVDELFRYMHGGTDRKREREKLKAKIVGLNNVVSVQSAAYRETDKINVDVTGPGALIALGLMYLRTENSTIASKLVLPETPYMMDHMRPDFMMMRVVCRSLIMWKQIRPTKEWVLAQSPDFITGIYLRASGQVEDANENDIHDQTLKEAVTVGYYNIVTGACLAIALKYAGTGNQTACATLLHWFDFFAEQLTTQVTSVAQKLLRTTVRACVDSTLLSAAVVMAGSGDLEVLRRTRRMFGRVSSEVSYGDHMATSMAVGFLFLGNGTYTLGTSNEAVAALLCALYPKFPTHVSDNRGHLQALRHLWVLAVESRCLVTRDVDTREVCPIPISLSMAVGLRAGNNSGASTSKPINLVTPCLLPDWNRIKSISINSPRYYPVVIDFADEDAHANLLSSRTIFVKRKTGHLSYQQDPRGIRSLFARSFPKVFSNYDPGATATGAGVEVEVGRLQGLVKSFSADPHVLAFANHLCVTSSEDGPAASQLAVFCTSILQECLAQGKPDILQTYLALYQILNGLESADCEAIWNVKLVVNFYRSEVFRKMAGPGTGSALVAASSGSASSRSLSQPLLNDGFVASLEQKLETFHAQSATRKDAKVENYFATLGSTSNPESIWQGLSKSQRVMLGRLLVLNDVPMPSALAVGLGKVREQAEELGVQGREDGDGVKALLLAEELPQVPLDLLKVVALSV